jgi:hypothetical protein
VLGITTRAPTGLSHRNTVGSPSGGYNRRAGHAGVRRNFSKLMKRPPQHVDESASNPGRKAQHVAENRHKTLKPVSKSAHERLHLS